MRWANRAARCEDYERRIERRQEGMALVLMRALLLGSQDANSGRRTSWWE